VVEFVKYICKYSLYGKQNNCMKNSNFYDINNDGVWFFGANKSLIFLYRPFWIKSVFEEEPPRFSQYSD
jgi:hypothetical protein